ncbi:unnamed protein product [Cuscuta campestris]|uniref:Uncharacterized protein n=1 Tax=Cuscuta campestris TaxID=132261 RepID=A0A484MK98_9ASTE|nr:unnamed protein product [Cuscuta campestris]
MKLITLPLAIAAAAFIFFFTITTTTTIATATIITPLNNSSLSSSSNANDLDPSKLSYKFAVTWPAGFCKINKCAQRPADLPKNFTIHGLWPNYDGECTDSTDPFDFNALAPIFTDLNARWPNLKSNLQPDLFWKDEWNKHGKKCGLFTVQSYFESALYLYKLLLKGLTVLRDADPRKSTVESIQSVAEFAGKKPFVMCQTAATGINYLYELRFCIKGNKKFTDCGPQSAQDRFCSQDFKYSVTLGKSLLARLNHHLDDHDDNENDGEQYSKEEGVMAAAT